MSIGLEPLMLTLKRWPIFHLWSTLTLVKRDSPSMTDQGWMEVVICGHKENFLKASWPHIHVKTNSNCISKFWSYERHSKRKGLLVQSPPVFSMSCQKYTMFLIIHLFLTYPTTMAVVLCFAKVCSPQCQPMHKKAIYSRHYYFDSEMGVSFPNH